MSFDLSKNIVGLTIAIAVILGANKLGLLDRLKASDSIPVSIQPNEPLTARTFPNGIQVAQQIAMQQDQEAKALAQPFYKNVNNLFNLNDGNYLGTITLKTVNADTVFIVRDIFDNQIKIVAQVPVGEEVKVKAPVGQYKIQYAQNTQITNPSWQGLENFWGYGTNFNESVLKHEITIKPQSSGGYLIQSTGYIVGMGSSHPRNIRKNDFVN